MTIRHTASLGKYEEAAANASGRKSEMMAATPG